MKQWFISKFKKKKAVRIFLLNKDKRLTQYWVLPKGLGEITIGKYTFKITPHDFVLLNNVPTYFYNVENAAPVSFEHGKVVELSPAEFNMSIEAHVARDVFAAAQGSLLSTEGIIILVAVLVCALGLGYYLSSELTAIRESLSILGI